MVMRPDVLLEYGARLLVDGRAAELVRHVVGPVEFPTGELVFANATGWSFDGTAGPVMVAGAWTSECVLAVFDDGDRWPVAFAVGDPGLVSTWRAAKAGGKSVKVPAIGTAAVVYDRARAQEVLGLRGSSPFDFGSGQARLAAVVEAGACPMLVGDVPVGVGFDDSRASRPHPVWEGVAEDGNVVAVLVVLTALDLDGAPPAHSSGKDEAVSVATSPLGPMPEELLSFGTRHAWPDLPPTTLTALDAGPVDLPTGRLVFADPAGDLAAGPRCDLPPGPAPVTVSVAPFVAGARGCGVAVGEVSAVASWQPTDGMFAVDAGTGCVFDLGHTDAVAAALAAPDRLDELLADVVYAGFGRVVVDGVLLAVAFDCGVGDGSYRVWAGQDATGRPVAALADLDLLHRAVGRLDALDGEL